MQDTVDYEARIKAIYRAHYRDVYQYLYYFTGKREHAEDLTQEVFIRVLDALGRYEERSSVKTWILHIAKHVAIDDYRKRRVQTLFGMELLKGLPSLLGRPEAELASKEEQLEIEQAMQKMKPHHRNVLILRGIKAYSIRETAEILGTSEAKVRVDFHRATKELKKVLHVDWIGGLANEYSK